MAFLTCPNMVSLAIHATNNGKQIANILHARFGAYPVLADIVALNAAVAPAIAGDYEPLMSANLLLTDLTTTGLTLINDFQDVASFGASPGSAAGDPLPANNSLVCTLRSALTGRSARGRIYTFPTGAGNVASTGGDLYETAYANAVEAFWQGVSAAINGAGWEHVILSKFTSGVERAAGVGFLVTDVAVRNSVADSQRKRLPKGH